MNPIARNTICLWYDKDAEDAARFYAATFPDSSVDAVLRAPGDYPNGKAGNVLTVQFTVLGIPCLGLNGGPAFRHSEAFSFQVATDTQEETDILMNISPQRTCVQRTASTSFCILLRRHAATRRFISTMPTGCLHGLPMIGRWCRSSEWRVRARRPRRCRTSCVNDSGSSAGRYRPWTRARPAWFTN